MPTEKANPTPNGNVPFQVPPLELSELFAGRRNGGITQSNGQYDRSVTAAMSRFKFRLWNCLSYSQNSETAGLHKAIINIKRSRRQAVTALNIIVIVNYPFEKHYILASLVKGRWIDGKAQALILLLSACDMPTIFMLQTFCRQDGGIACYKLFQPCRHLR